MTGSEKHSIMTESEKYKLSTYQTIKNILKNDAVTIELVKCTLDEKLYIKKTYHEDKRALFNKLKGITNPHIPRIFEVFFGKDTIIIEQYIDGKNLEEQINEKHIFTRKSVKQIMEGLLDALYDLHKNGLVHRDVKPGNVIVTDDGTAVLIDYGIARILSKNGGNDTEHLGTVGYAAPEQFGFAPSDYRTDIYAFGITMSQIIDRHNSCFYVRKIIKKCAEFDPDRRFQTVRSIQKRIAIFNRARLVCYTVIIAAFMVSALLLINTGKNAEIQADPENSDRSPDIKDDEQIVCDTITYIGADDISYIQLLQNGKYETSIALSDKIGETLISADKNDDGFSISIDNKYSFHFEKDDLDSPKDYESGEIYGEIVFYDFNEDGVLDIIPVLSEVVLSDLNPGEPAGLMKNYVLGWCIYLNQEDDFVLADGEMRAYNETLYFYENSSGVIYTDDLCYYIFDSGRLEYIGL